MEKIVFTFFFFPRSEWRKNVEKNQYRSRAIRHDGVGEEKLSDRMIVLVKRRKNMLEKENKQSSGTDESSIPVSQPSSR